MIEEYKKYLNNKGTKNFWKKAKQKEYTIDAVNKIYNDLTNDFHELTTRNSITLRYLGLIVNLGGDNLQISNAGETFLNSLYKQKILDEQIMKVYLDCPKLNDNLSIKIAPMEVLLTLLHSLEYISFDEYKLFVCWINDKNEISFVVDLIHEYRNSKNKTTYADILDKKSKELSIDDFSDNVKRFFDMLLISSYIKKEGEKITSNLSKKDIEIILESFSLRDFSDSGYFNYLNTNNGWQIYTINPNYLRVIESLEKKTTEEQEEIVNTITGGLKLPDISNIKPQIIEMEIDEDADLGVKTRRKISPRLQKIDFELRDSNNRTAGDFAEKIVIKHEIGELNKNYSKMVNKVEQVSLKDDTLGYDVLSFDFDGSEKHIEVKAVRNIPAITFRFFISENEITIARKDKNYHLYIVFDYLSETPFIYKMPNPFANKIPGVTIDPIKYLVTVRIKK
ncbi:MAG: hypothetical protein UU10_C0005G0004 [Parcubacteria group bacterium GW2011_GWF1_40_6]|nr:MAG: hypothetical protein UU10_C0005G0004 [Parcubacteria group bacterium GW2011_GWF1_40_6]HBD95710.1 hypothetical protein [Spirochaetia bacterium]